jgi:hypothetical protein
LESHPGEFSLISAQAVLDLGGSEALKCVGQIFWLNHATRKPQGSGTGQCARVEVDPLWLFSEKRANPVSDVISGELADGSDAPGVPSR